MKVFSLAINLGPIGTDESKRQMAVSPLFSQIPAGKNVRGGKLDGFFSKKGVSES